MSRNCMASDCKSVGNTIWHSQVPRAARIVNYHLKENGNLKDRSSNISSIVERLNFHIRADSIM